MRVTLSPVAASRLKVKGAVNPARNNTLGWAFTLNVVLLSDTPTALKILNLRRSAEPFPSAVDVKNVLLEIWIRLPLSSTETPGYGKSRYVAGSSELPSELMSSIRRAVFNAVPEMVMASSRRKLLLESRLRLEMAGVVVMLAMRATLFVLLKASAAGPRATRRRRLDPSAMDVTALTGSTACVSDLISKVAAELFPSAGNTMVPSALSTRK